MNELVLNQLKWLAVYMGSAFVISILFSFPIDWFVAIPVFLLISLCRRGLFLKKLGIKDRGKPINISFTVIKNSSNQYLQIRSVRQPIALDK